MAGAKRTRVQLTVKRRKCCARIMGSAPPRLFSEEKEKQFAVGYGLVVGEQIGYEALVRGECPVGS